MKEVGIEEQELFEILGRHVALGKSVRGAGAQPQSWIPEEGKREGAGKATGHF